MQENQVSNPVNQSVSDSVAAPIVAGQPKSNNFLVILLSILLIISVAISGFFVYQTQRLIAELKIKNEELIIKISDPTTEPVATESTEIDPTANWETYTNSKFNFSYKYPSDLKISDKSTPEFVQLFMTSADSSREIVIESNLVQKEELPFYPTFTTSNDTSFGSLSAKSYIFANGYCDSSVCPDKKPFVGVVAYNNNTRYVYKLYGDTKLNDIEDQILSTFKFTD